MAYKQRIGIPAATQSILTDDPDFLLFIVERVIQEVLEAEMTAHLHAEPYERSSERRGYRNGYKPRQLNTRVGTLSLQLPQDRDGTFATQLFARYQPNEKSLVLALMEMYVEDVSTPERGCPLRTCAARRANRQPRGAHRRRCPRRRAPRDRGG